MGWQNTSTPRQKRKSRLHCQQEKSWPVFWDEGTVIIVNFLPSGILHHHNARLHTRNVKPYLPYSLDLALSRLPAALSFEGRIVKISVQGDGTLITVV
jgi:hypothetical protein